MYHSLPEDVKGSYTAFPIPHMLDTYQTNKPYVTQITKSVSETVKKTNLLLNKPPKSAWSQSPPKVVHQRKGKSDNSSTFSNQSKDSSVTSCVQAPPPSPHL
eukprot:11127955-Ditylum_brightwellii.AAC.1